MVPGLLDNSLQIYPYIAHFLLTLLLTGCSRCYSLLIQSCHDIHWCGYIFLIDRAEAWPEPIINQNITSRQNTIRQNQPRNEASAENAECNEAGLKVYAPNANEVAGNTITFRFTVTQVIVESKEITLLQYREIDIIVSVIVLVIVKV